MKFLRKYSLALVVVSLCFSSGNVSSMNYQPINQPEKVWHISHKRLLGCLKEYGLDIDRMWDRIDEDSIGKKIEPIKRQILNFLKEGWNGYGLDIEKAYGEKLAPDLVSATEHIAQRILKFFTTLKNRINADIPTKRFWMRFLKKEFDLPIVSKSTSEKSIKKIEQILGDVQIMDRKLPLKIECINKIKDLDCHEKFHVVSIDNIDPKPESIIYAIALVMAYHFTDESIEQRLRSKDDTFLDLPLLTIRITQNAKPVKPESQINSASTVKALIETEPFAFTCNATGLNSKFYSGDDIKFSQLNSTNLFEELDVESSAAQTISQTIENALMPLIILIAFNNLYYFLQPPTIATISRIDLSSPNDMIMPGYNVHFTSENGNIIGCSLDQNLTLSCCPYNDIAPCTSFNILDNTTPLHSCCMADSSGMVHCSTTFCDISSATPSLCSPKILGHADNLLNPSEKDLAIDKELQMYKKTDQDVPMLHKLLKKIESAFNLDPEYRIKTIEILQTKLPMERIWTTRKKLILGQQLLLPKEPIIGHELAHMYQFVPYHKLGKTRNNEGTLDRPSGPGQEIDADVLGALATYDHDNIKRIALGWLSVDYFDPRNILPCTFGMSEFCILHNAFEQGSLSLQHLCSLNIPEIDNSNSLKHSNIKKTKPSFLSSPHPHTVARAIILFKLDTMIHAYAQFVDNATNVCPNNQFNRTQMIELNK